MREAKSKLTNIEFLALEIFLRPGRSGRFYQKALHKYRFPKEHKRLLDLDSTRRPWYRDENGKWVRNPRPSSRARMGSAYFNPTLDGTAVDKYWTNWSSDPRRGYWVLADRGLDRVRSACEKLGLPDLTKDRDRYQLPPHVKSNARKLVEFWRAQGGTCRRPDLKDYYDRISNASVRHSSLYVTAILRKYGRQVGVTKNPATGRQCGVWKLKEQLR